MGILAEVIGEEPIRVPWVIPDTVEARRTKPWDWEWIVQRLKEVGTSPGPFLTHGFVKLFLPRKWDGKGNSWTAWEFTEQGLNFKGFVETIDNPLALLDLSQGDES